MSVTELPGQPRLEYVAGTVYRIGYRFDGAGVTDMKTPLWLSRGVFSLVSPLLACGIAILARFGNGVGADNIAVLAKQNVAFLFVKAKLPECVLQRRGKRWHSLTVLGDDSLPNGGLACNVVDDHNLAIAELFQPVNDNRVFLVLLDVITSFHKRCQPVEPRRVYAWGVTCLELQGRQ